MTAKASVPIAAAVKGAQVFRLEAADPLQLISYAGQWVEIAAKPPASVSGSSPRFRVENVKVLAPSCEQASSR
jgi:hypothetical protein